MGLQLLQLLSGRNGEAETGQDFLGDFDYDGHRANQGAVNVKERR